MTLINPSRVWRIGLTGGIGSGKSTVAGILAQWGATIIDADAISRSVTAPNGRALPEIERQFGAHMVQPDVGLDRQAMRQLVFSDPQARQRLENIVHPLVAEISHERIAQALAQGQRCIVHDLPLLVEAAARWRPVLDRVWVVDCEIGTQVERVMARSGLARAEVARIIAQQAPRAQRLACADAVLYNQDLSLVLLRQQLQP